MTQLVDFSKFSSVRVGGVHEVAVLESIEDALKPEFAGRVMIGGANNLLVSPNPPAMMMLGGAFDYINLSGDVLSIGAATKSGKIYNFAKKHNIGGFEFLQNIPGTLGGLIKMNAGLCGVSISDDLLAVRLGRGWIERERMSFSYRKSGIDEPIFCAKFKISREFDAALAADFAAKRANQPKGASFGSCFVNPPGDYAGRLIEAAGLKGYAIGGAKFSEQHANFIVNFNAASFADVTGLINLAHERVLEKFGIELKTEVVIL
ncbi:UDP-N-acetylmuramate dehydrogenase [uncultured Campylobacter sp.]|uniref:UDP-N-acetylmuramate dehydrogenase n=1 Tax=uncultured Campylobacter sp. TaxID=218934 RepID=UPI0026113A65|nr:UDP-N-acetylmuramate dehydrogenase [uncultured Campylobacter sp.]